MPKQFMGRTVIGAPFIDFPNDSGVAIRCRVTELANAVRAGDIDGDVYADGEVWLDPQSLRTFIAKRIPA
jgi:hypothetical protein